MNKVGELRQEVPAGQKKLHFIHLPGFARFLLDEKFEIFVPQLLAGFRSVNFPVLKHFEFMGEEKLLELSRVSQAKLLTHIAENRLGEYIDESLKTWREDQFPLLARDQVLAEDISLSAYVGKKIYAHFLPEYTTDINLILAILAEIDDYYLYRETESLRMLLTIQREKMEEINLVLQKKEEQLLQAQEIGNMGSFEWDLIGRNSYFSPGLKKIFEIESLDSFKDFLKYVDADDQDRVHAALAKSLHGDGVYECEYRYKKDGHEKIIWSRGIVSFAGNRAYKMTGIIVDATERNEIVSKLQTLNKSLLHVNEKLRRSEERNQKMIAEVQDYAIIMLDKDGIIQNWNLGAERIKGYKADEIIGKNFRSFYLPGDLKNGLPDLLIEEASQKGRAASEGYRVRKDGSIFWANVVLTALHNDKGEIIGFSKVTRDLTDKKIAEDNLRHYAAQLKEREQSMQQLIDKAPEAIVVTDEKGEIRLWNPKACEIFGWQEDEVMGKILSETIISPQNRGTLNHEISRLKVGGDEVSVNSTIELNALDKDGNYIPVYFTVSVSRQAGELILIAFIRNISEEKKIKSELQRKTKLLAELNQALEQKNRDLEHSNLELTSFSYVASHDLQEPLRKIKTFSNLIVESESLQLSDKGKQLFERINASISRMQRLIEDLLTFSRTHTANHKLEHVDLNAVLSEVKDAVNDASHNTRVIIDAERLPVISGVSFQFYQVFENLIGNSIKYAKPGVLPCIRITSSVVNGQMVPIPGVNPSASYHEIIFADNGIGFEQKHAGKIFEIFQRLHGKEEYSGTGIGLAICKKIINNHGGAIKAQGRPDEGAAFYVYLPDQNNNKTL